MERASVSEIAQAIAAYVERNPEAQDTLEGIIQWWLPEAHHQARTAQIKEALDELVAAGLITAHKAKDAQILYRATRPATELDATPKEP
jgi:Fe2+ or Zn2+ uptake regulation protein